jgi:hypothetical protein
MKENICTATISEGNDNNMIATSWCYHFIGSGSDIVIILLTDDSCVYMCSFTGSGSDIVIIPLTDDSCVYMFSCIGSGSHIVIIPLTDGSCVSVLFHRKWFSYCCHSSHWWQLCIYVLFLQEVVIILLAFPSLMVAVCLFSFIGSDSHIVIIPPTADSCVFLKVNMYTQLSSVRGMITISEPLPVKEHIYIHSCHQWEEWKQYQNHFLWNDNIYTQLPSVRGMITIWEPLPVKKEHIYTAVIRGRNDNNMRIGSDIVFILLTDDSCVYICALLQEVVLILLSFLSLMTAVYTCSLLRMWFWYCYHSSHRW